MQIAAKLFSRLVERHALVLQQILQLSARAHFEDDVGATDEFALDVELRDNGG